MVTRLVMKSIVFLLRSKCGLASFAIPLACLGTSSEPSTFSWFFSSHGSNQTWLVFPGKTKKAKVIQYCCVGKVLCNCATPLLTLASTNERLCSRRGQGPCNLRRRGSRRESPLGIAFEFSSEVPPESFSNSQSSSNYEGAKPYKCSNCFIS